MTLAISGIQHQNYSIEGKLYCCNNCHYSTKSFGFIVDHIRLEECKSKKPQTKKRNNIERWGKSSLSVMRLIKYRPTGLTNEDVKKTLSKFSPREIRSSITYLVKTGKIDRIKGRLYPGRYIL